MEVQAGGGAEIGEAAVADGVCAVDECVGDGPVKGPAFEGGPAAAVGEIVLGDGPGAAADDDQVGKISFTDIAPAVNPEQVGGGVGHHPDDLHDRETSALGQLEHHHQRVLYGRQTRRCMEVVLHLLGVQMWCVVGGHGLDAALTDGSGYGLTVRLSLDGRIAFDHRTVAVIVPVVEPHIMYAHLGADAGMHRMGF